MSPILIRLAWRNVLRNWRHSTATLLAITAGFTAVSLFDGFIRSISEQIRDGYIHRATFGHVVVVKKDAFDHFDDDFWKYNLSLDEQRFIEDFLRHDPDFSVRARTLGVTGMASNGRNNTVFVGAGYDPVESARIRGANWEWNAISGKPLQLASSASILLGQGLGTSLDCESRHKESPTSKYGAMAPEERPFSCHRKLLQLSATTEHAQVNAVEADVAGLMDAGVRDIDRHWISLPLELAQKLLDTDRVSMFAILLKEEAAAPGFIQRLREASEKAGLRFDVLPWYKHPAAAEMKNAVQIVTVFRNLFTAVVATIAVLSIANTMMKSVSERFREIGTLRSFGFLQRDLSWMFAAEGFFLSLLACAAGWALTLAISWAITRMGLSYRAGILSTPIPLQVLHAPLLWIGTTLFLLALSTGTSWLTARGATRMPVADALRHA